MISNSLSANSSIMNVEIDLTVSNLAQSLAQKVDNSYSARVVIGKIAIRESVNPELGEEFYKAILKSSEIQNSFTVISNQYTRYISRKTSDSEILTIAESAKADYILRGEIKRIDAITLEIFLSLIDMKTMGEIGVSALYQNKSDNISVEYVGTENKDFSNQSNINGLIGSYNFIKPQNKNFANKVGKQLSFDAGFIFTLNEAPSDFLGINSLLEFQFSYIRGDLTNSVSFYNIKPENGEIFLEKEQLNEFNIYSGLIGIDLNPKITESLFLIGGVSLTYGAMVFNINKIDQNLGYEQNQKYDQNSSTDKRIISFFSPGYSGGLLLKLTPKSQIILFARYFSSFYSKDTEWRGIKAGIILSFQNNQKGFTQ